MTSPLHGNCQPPSHELTSLAEVLSCPHRCPSSTNQSVSRTCQTSRCAPRFQTPSLATEHQLPRVPSSSLSQKSRTSRPCCRTSHSPYLPLAPTATLLFSARTPHAALV